MPDTESQPKRSFFSIYKKGQGKYIRWGTVGGLALIALTGAYWISRVVLANQEPWVQAIVGGGWVLAFTLLIFWIVNTPKLAEFMIATESEMRKVTWPSRQELITSTRVVISLTMILGLLLWIVDVIFLALFQLIKLD